MSIDHFGMGVRRVHSGNYIVCEVEQGGEFVEFWRTNSISNDYASTESRNYCYAKVRELQLEAMRAKAAAEVVL